MLDSVDEVDWKLLQGCYETAEEMPNFLRALLSPSAKVRAWGLEEVMSAVWHQGTVYEVSAAVIPFLYELIECDGVPDKGDIADIVATVANGHSYLEVHVRTPDDVAVWESIHAKTGRTLATELAKELGHVAAAKQMVLKRLDVLYPYLLDPDPGVRGAVAQAVGCFPEVVARLLPDLEAAMRDELHEYPLAVLERVVEAGRARRCN